MEDHMVASQPTTTVAHMYTILRKENVWFIQTKSMDVIYSRRRKQKTMTLFLTPQKIRQMVYESYQDVCFEMDGKPVVLYADSGSTQVETDQSYTFDTWEDMLKSPIFYGKTLAEAAPCLIPQEPWA